MPWTGCLREFEDVKICNEPSVFGKALLLQEIFGDSKLLQIVWFLCRQSKVRCNLLILKLCVKPVDSM